MHADLALANAAIKGVHARKLHRFDVRQVLEDFVQEHELPVRSACQGECETDRWSSKASTGGFGLATNA